MATTQDFVDHVFEQTELAHRLSARKMFGEFALYLDGKVVALLCDNQVFVKPTPEGRALLGRVTEGFPFPGAKPHIQADEWLDDRERLTQLLLVTHAALPEPKPKAASKAVSKGTPQARPTGSAQAKAQARSTATKPATSRQPALPSSSKSATPAADAKRTAPAQPRARATASAKAKATSPKGG